MSQTTSCRERGKFPSDENHDCKGYVICLIGGINNFTQYQLSCPQGSIYSHLEQQCTNATNYKCYPNFNCTSVNNFTTPGNADCGSKSFISCIMGINEMATARLLECPLNTTFDSNLKMCIDERQSKCNISIVNPYPSLTNHNQTKINITTTTLRPSHPNNAVSISINVHYMLVFIIILECLT